MTNIVIVKCPLPRKWRPADEFPGISPALQTMISQDYTNATAIIVLPFDLLDILEQTKLIKLISKLPGTITGEFWTSNYQSPDVLQLQPFPAGTIFTHLVSASEVNVGPSQLSMVLFER